MVHITMYTQDVANILQIFHNLNIVVVIFVVDGRN